MTGVGWVLFAQVFFVAVVVGLGGQVVFVSASFLPDAQVVADVMFRPR